jgi:hypothetical protein
MRASHPSNRGPGRVPVEQALRTHGGRRRLRRPVVAAMLLTSISILLIPSFVSAHRAREWYGARWDRNSVVWRFDKGFPKRDGARKAVVKGSRQWNRSGARLRFRFESRSREAGPLDPCSLPPGKNFVQWGSIDGPGGRVAVTATCTLSQQGIREMYSFQMKFDRAESWHMDPSTQPAPFETDMWAVASHEFGHASGRITGGPGDQGHFDEESKFCPDLGSEQRHTMCPSYDLIGVVMRTLERHDKDAFRRAYGTRD